MGVRWSPNSWTVKCDDCDVLWNGDAEFACWVCGAEQPERPAKPEKKGVNVVHSQAHAGYPIMTPHEASMIPMFYE